MNIRLRERVVCAMRLFGILTEMSRTQGHTPMKCSMLYTSKDHIYTVDVTVREMGGDPICQKQMTAL